PQEPVPDGEQADAHQVRRAADRRHERVLDGPLPPLPGDRVRRLHEDEREVAPQQRADQKVELRSAQVEPDAARAERAQSRGEEADGEDTDHAVEKPHDLPPPVTADRVHRSLGEAEHRIQLASLHSDVHGATTPSASSSASPSSWASKDLPVSCMKTSSSVSDSCRSQSSAGVPSARTRPLSIIRTRSNKAAASPM